jgi:phage FluMu protein Com
MVKGEDFFNTVDYLEPRCPNCKVKIEWGLNTEWSDQHETQICLGCRTPLK